MRTHPARTRPLWKARRRAGRPTPQLPGPQLWPLAQVRAAAHTACAAPPCRGKWCSRWRRSPGAAHLPHCQSVRPAGRSRSAAHHGCSTSRSTVSARQSPRRRPPGIPAALRRHCSPRQSPAESESAGRIRRGWAQSCAPAHAQSPDPPAGSPCARCRRGARGSACAPGWFACRGCRCDTSSKFRKRVLSLVTPCGENY